MVDIRQEAMTMAAGFVLMVLSICVLPMLSPAANAWPGDVHSYMCPGNYSIDCNIADSRDFQIAYPYSGAVNHLCMDNKTDCMPRLVAEFYVKRYFVEGQKDPKLLGAAAHLLQDASCPDHWYPMREFFGRIFVPFAPGWVGSVERSVSGKLNGGEHGWNVSIEFQGNDISIDRDYLDGQKRFIQGFLAKEPKDSMGEIEDRIKSGALWNQLRFFKEWVLVGMIISVPLFAYEMWALKKKVGDTKKMYRNVDFILGVLVIAALAVLFLAIQLFY